MVKKNNNEAENVDTAEQSSTQTQEPITQVQSEAPEPAFQTDYATENVSRPMIQHPTISCGVCEHCGSVHYTGDVTMKVNEKGEKIPSYKGGKWVTLNATECKHYRGVNIMCSYCGEQFTGLKNRSGVYVQILGFRNLYVAAFPESPRTLVMWCSGYECMTRHQKRVGIIKN